VGCLQGTPNAVKATSRDSLSLEVAFTDWG
jgi:hypothetical protein